MACDDVGRLCKREDNEGDEDEDNVRACLRAFAIGHNVVTEDNCQYSGSQRKWEEPKILKDGAHRFFHEVTGNLSAHTKHVGDLIVDAKELLHTAFGNDDNTKDEKHRSDNTTGDGFMRNDGRNEPEQRTRGEAGGDDAQQRRVKEGVAGICNAQEKLEKEEGSA